MLRLSGNRKSPISNRLAIFAALLLVVTSLAGAGNSAPSSLDREAHFAAGSVTDYAPADLQSSGNTKVKKNRTLKVSLFLFRTH